MARQSDALVQDPHAMPVILISGSKSVDSAIGFHISHPSFMAEVFVTKDVPYGLRGGNILVLPKARTNIYGIHTIRFIGEKLWQNLPKKRKSPNH